MKTVARAFATATLATAAVLGLAGLASADDGGTIGWPVAPTGSTTQEIGWP